MQPRYKEADVRGDLVVVRDFRGEALLRRVWDDLGDRVVVTDDAGLAKLLGGDAQAPTIALPRQDVFLADPSGGPSGSRIEWSKMTPLP